MKTRKLILRNNFSAGDIVTLTAAVRELHTQYPSLFQTDVRTPFPELWEHNPYISRLAETDPSVELIDCSFPMIDSSNHAPFHMIHGFTQFLGGHLGLNLRPTQFKGDIHLTEEERTWHSQIYELIGKEIPFWILVAGGKPDVTIKWWDPSRYQQIVDYFKGKIQFVQVGASEHHHPTLRGVIDLRGQTDLRQLIRLVYHSQGVLCPVTLMMHLAAAVPVSGDAPQHRPCVIIAGGREPSHWEAYPHHQYIHTNGSLLCCDNGGCWKSRIIPLGDGDERDRPEHLCLDVVNALPRCMDIITADTVIQRIQMYFSGGSCRYLKQSAWSSAKRLLRRCAARRCQDNLVDELALRVRSDDFLKHIPAYQPPRLEKGIVICGGGLKYLPSAWVCINMLRFHGCNLAIQLWHLGENELDASVRELFKSLNVECVDALDVRGEDATYNLSGWPLKPFSILHCPFEKVLLLDADNVPVANPEYLFTSMEFRSLGAVFWPDFGRLGPERDIWRIVGVSYRDEPEFESGQILLDKSRCWRALHLAMWYNQNADFYYKHVHGDKDLFHMAFRKLRKRYAMPPFEVLALPFTMCQHDFEGRRIFQHRNLDKWSVFNPNRSIPGFLYESECRQILERFYASWGKSLRFAFGNKSERLGKVADRLLNGSFIYKRLGYDEKPMHFGSRGTIEFYPGRAELYWDLREESGAVHLLIAGEDGLTCVLSQASDEVWKGRWIMQQQMEVHLVRVGTKRGKPSLPRSSKQRIVLNAPINGYTGYGLHACRIVQDLCDFGYDVVARTMDCDEKFASIPENVRERMVCEIQEDSWELLLHPPRYYPPTIGKRVVYFTMWESTRIPAEGLQCLNAAETVVVPSKWNADMLKECGVMVPIRIVPLGVNTDVFHYRPMNTSGPCVFGVAGRMDGGGFRKGINDVIRLFQRAFPEQQDVILKVKAFPDCNIMQVVDRRIRFVQKYLDEREVANWFEDITCFVSACRGEGWGLMQQQALVTGRPIIACRFAGITEFFDESVGYCTEYSLEPAQGPYTNCGDWAEPDEEHMIHLMREVYSDRETARRRGLAGAYRCLPLSWRHSNRKLLGVLIEVGMINRP